MNHDTSQFPFARLRPIAACLAITLFTFTMFRLAIGAKAQAGQVIGLKLSAEGFSAPSILVSIPDGSGRPLVADRRDYAVDRRCVQRASRVLKVQPKGA